NLVINSTVNSLDVQFDRDMNAGSFTPADILSLVGPGGPISGPFTVTPRPAAPPAALANRVFRIGFPTQTLSGTYSLVIGPNIQSLAGESVDTNLNAGLDVLRGANPQAAVLSQVTTASGTVNVALTPNRTVTSTITITDPFVIQQSAAAPFQLILDIAHNNDPDLSATLTAPDGTVIKLFTNVGTIGPLPHANFQNTVLDDFGTVPIQNGTPPFSVTRYNPQLPFSGLVGHGSLGKWTLSITNSGSLSGTLKSWTLRVPKPLPGTGLGEGVADRFNAH